MTFALAPLGAAGDNGAMDGKLTHWLPALAIAVFLLAATLSYVVSYFALGQHAIATAVGSVNGSTTPASAPARIYSSKWEAMLFSPGAKIESLITGEDIATGSKGWD